MTIRVPRQVDHKARRDHITEALLDIVAQRGLEAISLRTVAEQAGVSIGRIQHYFASKDDLLAYAIEYQDWLIQQRWNQQSWPEGDPTPRQALRWLMLQMIPDSSQRRREWLVGVAYLIRMIDSPKLRALYIEGLPRLLDLLAGLIRTAQETGDIAPERDPAREAELLFGIADSQGPPVVLGLRTPQQATETIDYYLDHLFR
ncbi:TetR/AcrR family transcriptional regulator [Micromonospora sp. NPDC049559]|uniref:TetR/AcrR family transcriptional regulator n=1 Tax=Micromonospora sp. NPDC049559 TaxID=3155923 RepID=UPI003440E133